MGVYIIFFDNFLYLFYNFTYLVAIIKSYTSIHFDDYKRQRQMMSFIPDNNAFYKYSFY